MNTPPTAAAASTFAGIALPDKWALKLQASCRRGLVVVAGPTQSGKSTLAMRAVQELFGDARHQIIALESRGEDLSALSAQGAAVIRIENSNITDACSRSLRSTPDVVMIGEVRDQPTIWAARDLVLAGYTVFTTMHAQNVDAAIERMQQLAGERSLAVPVTIIATELINNDSVLVPVCDIHTNAESIFRISSRFCLPTRAMVRDTLRRAKPNGYFSRAQHAAFLVEAGLLKQGAEFYSIDSILPDERECSPTTALARFTAPRELTPVTFDDALLNDIKVMCALGWSTNEVAAMLTFAGYDVDGAAIDNALRPPSKSLPLRRRRRKTKVAGKALRKGLKRAKTVRRR